ncbi:hypothetical protein N656DRAFT_299775 [Canariomyces notabilis]|uniref:C2H2-type domain-containing protein n=1 Tax=Canariomyces notabilis TaxID=2074819 RepID=A0AAN6TAB6_9PEZI|nr:hypothetical protein N656DRAFT_299775 [Canariomyces arenarius]
MTDNTSVVASYPFPNSSNGCLIDFWAPTLAAREAELVLPFVHPHSLPDPSWAETYYDTALLEMPMLGPRDSAVALHQIPISTSNDVTIPGLCPGVPALSATVGLEVHQTTSNLGEFDAASDGQHTPLFVESSSATASNAAVSQCGSSPSTAGIDEPSFAREACSSVHRAPARVPSFQCGHLGCGKRFSNSADWKRHCSSLQHGGMRKFRCSLCSKRFTRKDNLRRHHKKHHGGNGGSA